MKLTEKHIESLIYNSPWLLDERYSIPKIKGSAGWGRQIDLGKGNNRFIDLLFKDNRDNRPVIVELKRGKVVRENIAQILEYRGLLLSLDEEHKDEWESEFESNFYIPKLLLIGASADEETIISANLSGIDLRFFENSKSNNIEFRNFKQLQVKIKEWNEFRQSGNRTLIERDDWLQEIIDLVSEFVNEFAKTKKTVLSTIQTIPKLNKSITKSYIDYNFPFLNIPVLYEGEQILGIYEFYDEHSPFSAEHFYIDIPFIWEYEIENELSQKAFGMARSFKSDNVVIYDKNEYCIPVFLVDRTVLTDQELFQKTLNRLLDLSIRIYLETYDE